MTSSARVRPIFKRPPGSLQQSPFEWATDSGNHETVEQVIREELQARDPNNSERRAKIQYRNLFSFVLKLLSRKGQKELSQDLLNREMAETSMMLSDHLAASALRSWIGYVDAKLEDHESRIEELERRTANFNVTTFYVPQRGGERGLLFDFNQTLRGRKRRMEELTAFADDREGRIAVLSGRGGVGKTKLLIDWAQGLEAWRHLWVNPYGKWAPESATEVPQQDTILIVDDAHQYSDLEQLIAYVANAPGGVRRKLIIATRPSGHAYVDEALAREADESFVRRFKPLQQPGPNAILEIAEEVLGAGYAQHAESLARVSADTPLITVVGGRLIARQQIGPELLANDEDFRNAVFAKFAADCEGNLPAGGGTRQELLQLVSAVQPVLEQDNHFADRAAALLSVRPDQVWRGLDDLEQRGVLVRGKGGLRIAPNLFGDSLLESASITRYGVSTGFADAVFSSFGETHLSNLLKNFAELDWRITQRDPESRLLDQIWQSLYTLFRGQNALERERFLRDIAAIAVFQSKAEQVAQIAMDEPVESVRFWSIRRVTQADVLRHLSPLLGVTIFHEPTSQDAFERLWTVAQHCEDDVHNAARNALKDAIAYRKYKNVAFNERILALVEGKSADSAAYQGEFTPLTLIDQILEREVDDQGYRGNTFTFGDQQSCFPDPNAPNDDADEDATGAQAGMHFTGKERDAESGLDTFGFRYYGSNMGRFMSPDPSGLIFADPANPQSFNLYSYVLNKPLTNIDPSGLALQFNCTPAAPDTSRDEGAGGIIVKGSVQNCTVFDDGQGNYQGFIPARQTQTFQSNLSAASSGTCAATTSYRISQGVQGVANLGTAALKTAGLGAVDIAGAALAPATGGSSVVPAAAISLYGILNVVRQATNGVAQIYASVSGDIAGASGMQQVGDILQGPVLGLSGLIHGLAAAQTRANVESDSLGLFSNFSSRSIARSVDYGLSLFGQVEPCH